MVRTFCVGGRASTDINLIGHQSHVHLLDIHTPHILTFPRIRKAMDWVAG